MAQDQTRQRIVRYGFAAAVTLIALVLAAAPLWSDAPGVLPAAGVVGFAIAMWATGVMPVQVATLTMFLAAVVLDVAPPEVVFSGFHSGAVWLVFGGIVLSLATQRSGLATRIVQALITQLPPRYFGMALGLITAGMMLGFVMPAASGRAVLVAPLAVALAGSLGFAEHSRARNGLIIAAGWGTTIPLFGVLPANVVNMAFTGATESIYGIHYTYFDYLLLNFPVVGLIGIPIVAALVTLLYGAPIEHVETRESRVSMARGEARLLMILLTALALWATDSLHGVSPAWIALGAALLCVTPGVGVVPASVLTNDLNYSSWFFVAGVIGVGAIANFSGLGEAIGKAVLDIVPLTRDGGIVTFYELFAIGSAVTMVATAPAATPIMTAFADVIAGASGWPLETVLLAQVPTWMIYPLPHQVPPVVITMALGGVPIAAALRLLVPYFVIGIVVLL
ncbi:MAG: SLC13 family permease, partial [Alphaproteobacteria bacterium]